MQPEEYEYMYRLEEKFWWYAAMRRITDAVVESQLRSDRLSILDAGCGTGINLAHFAAHGSHRVFGLDFSADATTAVRKRGLRTVTQASLDEIPFASESFDLVVSFDVICQVPAPLIQAGLREMQRVLRPGGAMFVRVPAFAWMHSSHDDAVNNLHRFNRSELMQEIHEAGMKVEWISYANFFLFPLAMVHRALKGIGIGKGSEVRPLPESMGWMDAILRRILQSEASVFRAGVRFPFGLSLVCLARKQ